MGSRDSAPPATGKEGGLVHLNRVKLLLILDTLLREGSVSAAAASMGVQISAMSRMLGELRDHYGDPILVRTGKGMRPTDFAESLRLRVRALAEEAEALLADPSTPAPIPSADGAIGKDWRQEARLSPPPLAVTRGEGLDAAPTPAGIARRIAAIGGNAEPHRRLAKYIAYTAPGPGRSRPLTQEEARDALGIILRGEADPMQVGALLITIQYRGVTAVELAGFVRAIREHIAISLPKDLRPDLDWPAYLSPRWRDPPWFVHAARLVAMAGHRVLLHGNFGSGDEGGKLEAAAEDASIPVCITAQEIRDAFRQGNIAYMPLGALLPQLQALLALYPLFEMRTPMNNAIHLINPLEAGATVLGAAGSSNRDLYRRVAHLLGAEHAAVIGSNRDFAQVPPGRATPLFRLVGGRDVDLGIRARPVVKPEIPKVLTQREYWSAVWSGAARDEQAEDTILHTAAVGLLCLSRDPGARIEDALEQARALWSRRRR